jgi:hypothetical protein
MKTFHVYLYGPSKGPLPTSFEQAQERLTALPKLYFEPDGSFVWSLDQGRQQVFGMIYDAAGCIQYSELRGTCHLATWRRVVEALTGGISSGCEVFGLPNQQLQELQRFESEQWPSA